ncbi:hypothetical protein ACMV5I_25655 [Serratia sp. T13T92]|jgi:hypothetical protein|uniref:hypothetical protein n=1 Tax=Serratia sp. T13T92 TaxID=3397496 RepID=UPI0039E08BFB
MYFIGYHGTSELSALNILSVGIQERFLSPNGQIGQGFYIAKINGTLPQWGAANATYTARQNQPYFTRMISFLTGEANNPWLDKAAQQTILKIYTTRPLRHCKWNIMNPGDLEFLKTIRYDTDGPGLDLKRDCQWLQMVVPPEEIQYLRLRRDDGIFERPHNWIAKSSFEGERDLRSAPRARARSL